MSAMPGGRALDLPMREAPTVPSQLLFRENTMLILNVSGMTCGHCVSAITKAVKGVPAVEDVQVDRDLGEVRVFGQAEEAAVRAAIVEEGYGVQAVA
jgi:copper chaperone